MRIVASFVDLKWHTVVTPRFVLLGSKDTVITDIRDAWRSTGCILDPRDKPVHGGWTGKHACVTRRKRKKR